MLYSILCYDSEAVVGALTKQQDDELMARLTGATESLAAAGRLGPSLRLMPTTTGATLRGGEVLDGPFAETKEQLLGFWVLDCETLEEAVETARLLAREKPSGAFEVRPLRWFDPGSGLK
jgi:hypothetical protein